MFQSRYNSLCILKYVSIQIQYSLSVYLNMFQSRYNSLKVYTLPSLTVITKLPVLQELLNTRTNNIYAEGCDDYVINEMINILCNE